MKKLLVPRLLFIGFCLGAVLNLVAVVVNMIRNNPNSVVVAGCLCFMCIVCAQDTRPNSPRWRNR